MCSVCHQHKKNSDCKKKEGIFKERILKGKAKAMNNNLRMSGAMVLMLKKSADRRQREQLKEAFEVKTINSNSVQL